MSGHHIIPNDDGSFKSYIDTAIPYLTAIANSTRLGMSAANVTLLNGLQTSWDKTLQQ